MGGSEGGHTMWKNSGLTCSGGVSESSGNGRTYWLTVRQTDTLPRSSAHSAAFLAGEGHWPAEASVPANTNLRGMKRRAMGGKVKSELSYIRDDLVWDRESQKRSLLHIISYTTRVATLSGIGFRRYRLPCEPSNTPFVHLIPNYRLTTQNIFIDIWLEFKRHWRLWADVDICGANWSTLQQKVEVNHLDFCNTQPISGDEWEPPM